MPTKFYFHEGCRSDVNSIVAELNTLSKKGRSKLFLERLIETYQNIYENPSIGMRFYEDVYPPVGGIEKKCINVPGFPYLIIYFSPAPAKLIVVSIVYSAKAMLHY